MNFVVSFLVLLYCLSFPYNCHGIHCKKGIYNTVSGSGFITPAACPEEKQFCYGVICLYGSWLSPAPSVPCSNLVSSSCQPQDAPLGRFSGGGHSQALLHFLCANLLTGFVNLLAMASPRFQIHGHPMAETVTMLAYALVTSLLFTRFIWPRSDLQ
uniref:Uncharacterized protein n=1 Tax=Globodera rostochiensis TaxID=31243 RepID=A0A914IE76_GLORO